MNGNQGCFRAVAGVRSILHSRSGSKPGACYSVRDDMKSENDRTCESYIKSMKRTIVSLLFALGAIGLIPSSASAQWVLLDSESNLLVREGLDHMYNLRYTEADSLFREVARKD